MKYIIAYDDTYNISYFCGIIRDDGIRWLLSASRQLKHAEIFNTRNDAENEIHSLYTELSEHDILAISEKDIFIAKLKDE